MTAVIPDLPLLTLSEAENELATQLRAQLEADAYELRLHQAYYLGENFVRDLGISIPPQLRGLHTVLGWPEIVVDSLEERLDVEGFLMPGAAEPDPGLWEIWTANRMPLESSLAHLDALIFGRVYVCGGSPDTPGGPPLLTVESPLHVTDIYDARTRTVTAALRVWGPPRGESGQPWDEASIAQPGRPEYATLYFPEQTITMERQAGGVGGSQWIVLDRDMHNLGVTPVARMVNRARAGARGGRSEISKSVQSIVDAACRALLRLEVGAEFFGAPQRYVLGATEEDFQSPDGTPKSAWETYIGRILMLERDEDGNTPQVGQFTAGDPSSQTKIVDMYREEISAKTGLPPHYLGQTTAIPASADAIRSAESRLIVRAERKQTVFGGWGPDVMGLALLIQRGAKATSQAHGIEVLWANPATPSVAAATDAAVKLVQAKILPPDSPVTLKMIGLTPGQIKQVQAAQQQQQVADQLALLAGQLNAAPGPAGAAAGPGPAPAGAVQ